jgi:endonuclease/exonuclease/phosphatase family metal-dependent hydrolase
MGLAKKAEPLLALAPDIVILQECASDFGEVLGARSVAWCGSNQRKGLGIAGLSDAWAIRERTDIETDFWWCLPVEVEGPMHFNLLGVWAFLAARQPSRRSFHDALEDYSAFVAERPAIVAGDFNNNVRWDTPRKPHHATAVAWMTARGLESAYHILGEHAQGREAHPTYFHQWNVHQPYHIDYCFLPSAWLSVGTTADAGKVEDWLQLSDHVPMVVDVTFDPSGG